MTEVLTDPRITSGDHTPGVLGVMDAVGYHPLFLFNEHGDCLAAKLRPGNVHSAEDWDELLLPEIERQQVEGKEIAFGADAAFAKSEIYEALEERGAECPVYMRALREVKMEIPHKPIWLRKCEVYKGRSRGLSQVSEERRPFLAATTALLEFRPKTFGRQGEAA